MPQDRYVTMYHHVELPPFVQVVICIALLAFGFKCVAEVWMLRSAQRQAAEALRYLPAPSSTTTSPRGPLVPGGSWR